MKKLFFLLFFLSFTIVYAQDYFPTDSGVKTTQISIVAFTNATIYVTPQKVIKKGTLLIEKEKLLALVDP